VTATTTAPATTDDTLIRVRRALVARFGAEAGGEAAADVAEWAVANTAQVADAANPAGLLYRVGQSKVRRYQRWRRTPGPLLAPAEAGEVDAVLLDLFAALRKLPEAQRIAVVLVHAHGERYADVAALLGVSTAAVTNHVHRGLVRLRDLLGEPDV
jgi:DNA-directed RNA polymerase specialized sigma24 family protein